ncbi:LAQU0S04e09010g1_1 [Lachancea quebecensis]|uniref:LAQU0S04e09010g1_1 n=1 Tax=Lachancea quebecensis TaxID=1654605 RepID=A0A0P1KQL3_9SACH|nr:LAQU0S04e09010g1_1 [Lachancea quebecensis]
MVPTSQSLSWDERLDNLLKWLKESEGFAVNENVHLQDTKRSGRGLYLKSGQLKKRDCIVSIPGDKQLNFYTVIYHISRFNRKLFIDGASCPSSKLASNENSQLDDPRTEAYRYLTNTAVLGLSSFQLLSLFILFEWKILPQEPNFTSFWKPFFDVLPFAEELRSIPATWICDPTSENRELIELLPAASRRHADRMVSQIENDWQTVSPFLQEWLKTRKSSSQINMQDLFSEFVHVYLVINSRCLYIEIPLKTDVADNLTMVPFVDFLNHNSNVDAYCKPRIESLRKSACGLGSFSIIVGDHEYINPGEEILLNYGAHSNDFLLNEYGFVLGENMWNYIDVSLEAMELISQEPVKKFLMENNYWGDYTISHSEVSFRLLVAFAAVVCPDLKKVEKFMLGYITESSFGSALSSTLNEFMASLEKSVKAKIESLEIITKSDPLCSQNVLTVYEGYFQILRNHLGNGV